MIKIITHALRFHITSPFSTRVIHVRRSYGIARPTRLNLSKKIEEKALELIFGKRKYANFTTKEKKIVDLYQQEKFKEGLIILPNTRIALEQEEVEKMLIEGLRRRVSFKGSFPPAKLHPAEENLLNQTHQEIKDWNQAVLKARKDSVKSDY